MKKIYHIPSHLQFHEVTSDSELLPLEPVIIDAIRRAIESAAGSGGEILSSDLESPETMAEIFSSDRYRADGDTYAVPSYDDNGRLQELPIDPAEAKLSWHEQITSSLVKTFGTYAPRGQTHYGLQTATVLVFADNIDGQSVFREFHLNTYKKDVHDHWETTDALAFPKGRYTFTVTGEAQGDHPFPNVAIVTDMQGKQFGDPIYTPQEIGFRIVFDVPVTIQPGDEEKGGSPFGIGIMGRGWGQGLIYTKCHGYWDTNPLTDPAFAGASDDDYWSLFLNLCNARAIDNLDVSEKYLREELIPRYIGPRGSTKTLTNYSQHNVKHFQEDLTLLRGLMIAWNKLWTEIQNLEVTMDSVILGGQLPGPSFQEPHDPDPQVMEGLDEQLKKKRHSADIIMIGILRLIQQDPLLTQFVGGLQLSSDGISVPRKEDISSELADLGDVSDAQHKILTKLNELLNSIARARHKLCNFPEKILDVPLVYEAVQTMVRGVNPHFDELVTERIADHKREESWIDIGLSAIGLVLFVGGLIVSAAGGPAGVIAFLELAGVTLGAVTAARSLDKADFLTVAAEASIVRGGGLVTLEAASNARFWAIVDTVLLGLDGSLQTLKLTRMALNARKARALEKVAEGAEELGKASEAASLMPFEELLQRSTSRGVFEVSEAELTYVQNVGRDIRELNVAGKIAEEAVERAVSSTGEYVQLATLFKQGNLAGVGIDLLYVRRTVFERIFGKLANPKDAAGIFGKATEQQRNQFIQALRKSANAEDLISFEVKFTKSGMPFEELLNAGRGGVQQNTAWYRGLLTHMTKAADPDVRATARLLEDVIGTEAQNLGRLTRIGIAVDPQGAFKLQRLTDPIIDLAHQSKALYARRGYLHHWAMKLVKAEREGNTALAQQLRGKYAAINQQVEALDAAVRQAKQAELASRNALSAIERASETLEEIATLSAKPQTPAVISMLHTATAIARLNLEIVKHSSNDAEADMKRANKINEDATRLSQELEKEM